MFTPNETVESMPSPRENALSNLRKVCRGLLEDFGSIKIGMALHNLVEKHREECLNLGNTVQVVNGVIDDHRRQS